MAERRRKDRTRDRDPDGVIANRVIQDIIQNASSEFRDYLQRSGTVPQGGGAVPVASGGRGPNRAAEMTGPVQGPQMMSPPISDIPGPPSVAPTGPMQGPPPAYPPMWGPPPTVQGEFINTGVPFPTPPLPDMAMPMPNMGPTTYEDGSTSVPYPQPWDHPFRRAPQPQTLSMPDILRILGIA